ncbi:hypothetical protein MPH_09757 [Macrophomina phaseolina MS6]|uniref:Nudix hydrolase domain-containing protein n=1 Tax=Macrophomina phaseolina (strain MS6) TaxID=1126212 RepID=K2QTM7_MACPH|nr:hypothetical protein MPH_09757 [Macrophomina phaseolina MS6]
MPQSTAKQKKPIAVPRPSASILLVSPTNEVLLLHRVQTSSSFPSAHVFPGGNCEAYHDGDIPAPKDPGRHIDGPVYRWAGIRECFEESGILLARREGETGLATIDEEAREKARKEIHNGQRKFGDVLKEWGVSADLDNLIPFTRWITPTNMPKRFTTQMYLYFMPLPPAASAGTTAATEGLPLDTEAVIPVLTSDGGIEHQAARFLPAAAWVEQARAGDIILFPPQFFLLHLVARHLGGTSDGSRETLQRQRDELSAFVREGGWGDKCVSPSMSAKRKSDGRIMLGLDKPGPELERSGREGIRDYVVLVDFRKEGPRNVEVRLRSEVLAEERARTEKL